VTDLRFDVFGQLVVISRVADHWETYAIGTDGKRSPAGFVIPDFIEEAELEQYLFDIFHERAVPGKGEIRRL
jgi:hypothetical protein